ncbi:MAG: hypothetical protein JWN45_2869 [Acidobacteriaceae bacterium]|jgi:hypothetical protein|nr:hypothetical protein [Acidobacteriaceae bacterium]
MRVHRIFSYIVVGPPQIFAVLLLLTFVAQCAWLIGNVPFSPAEQDHIWAGRQQLEFGSIPRSFGYSALTNVMAAAPMAIDKNRAESRAPTVENTRREVRRLRWLLRSPFLLVGLLLGVSVWYVARRLYGNAGGYIALALYCFSPAMVLRGASIQESGPSAWGTFGIVFTAIAISHNLYAPWKKWRYRTILLSVAAALAIGSHPAAMLLLPVALLFMLYLAPGRRWVALLVFVVATLLSAMLLYAAYGFHPHAMLEGIDLREWVAYTPKLAQAALLGDRKEFLSRFNPSVLVLLFFSVLTYIAWRRTRYFGNTAPLMVGIGLLYWALISPMAMIASIWALPFLFVFIGGIWADLLESNRGKWFLGALLLLLAENAYFCKAALSL